eukprot:gene23914-65976_t
MCGSGGAVLLKGPRAACDAALSSELRERLGEDAVRDDTPLFPQQRLHAGLLRGLHAGLLRGLHAGLLRGLGEDAVRVSKEVRKPAARPEWRQGRAPEPHPGGWFRHPLDPTTPPAPPPAGGAAPPPDAGEWEFENTVAPDGFEYGPALTGS